MDITEALLYGDDEEEYDNSPLNTILTIGGYLFIMLFAVGLISLHFLLNWTNLGQYYTELDYLKFTLPLACLASAITWLIKNEIEIRIELEKAEEPDDHEDD